MTATDVSSTQPASESPDEIEALITPHRPDDWSDLDQRMHYIVHLFRATQESADLYRAPFTPAQVGGILAGVIPGGDLG